MKLKYVKRINWVTAGVLLICLAIVEGNFGEQVTMGFVYAMLGISVSLLAFNLIFKRCPHCRTYLFRAGEFCSTCGGDLQKEKGGK